MAKQAVNVGRLAGPVTIFALTLIAAVAARVDPTRWFYCALFFGAFGAVLVLRLTRGQPPAEKTGQTQPPAVPPFADLAHEIRTPMNAILGMSALLKDSGLTQSQLEHASSIHASAELLLELVNDVLDYSKIENGKLSLLERSFSLRPLVEDVVRIIRQRVDEKYITLVVDVNESVPAALEGDRLRISQVLLNLLSNAVKFTPEQGGITLQVFVDRVEDQRLELHLAVTDSGVGIRNEKLQSIFESFEQADPSTCVGFGGSGLGLYICKRLVELMGGRIWVESRVGLGSAFHCTLWVGSTVIDTPLSVAQGSKILVVEDSAMNGMLARALLEKRGYAVTIAMDGREAGALLSTHCYDPVLMDCHLPLMNGFEAAAAQRSREAQTGRRVPIIAMTADVDDSERRRCFESGMDDFIEKPIRPEVLFRTIDSYLCPPL